MPPISYEPELDTLASSPEANLRGRRQRRQGSLARDEIGAMDALVTHRWAGAESGSGDRAHRRVAVDVVAREVEYPAHLRGLPTDCRSLAVCRLA